MRLAKSHRSYKQLSLCMTHVKLSFIIPFISDIDQNQMIMDEKEVSFKVTPLVTGKKI